ncbi:unnamed protein product [Nesidiocoris tenuis]|uniref:Uncharacterized protein n=1 Tax=Nesidiocoris tenuis TaxID=355587 RepID=A0A6H5GRL0_9HEMI|nr:unnamed protein product [Nesidiocoris tenuis]
MYTAWQNIKKEETSQNVFRTTSLWSPSRLAMYSSILNIGSGYCCEKNTNEYKKKLHVKKSYLREKLSSQGFRPIKDCRPSDRFQCSPRSTDPSAICPTFTSDLHLRSGAPLMTEAIRRTHFSTCNSGAIEWAICTYRFTGEGGFDKVSHVSSLPSKHSQPGFKVGLILQATRRSGRSRAREKTGVQLRPRRPAGGGGSAWASRRRRGCATPSRRHPRHPRRPFEVTRPPLRRSPRSPKPPLKLPPRPHSETTPAVKFTPFRLLQDSLSSDKQSTLAFNFAALSMYYVSIICGYNLTQKQIVQNCIKLPKSFQTVKSNRQEVATIVQNWQELSEIVKRLFETLRNSPELSGIVRNCPKLFEIEDPYLKIPGIQSILTQVQAPISSGRLFCPTSNCHCGCTSSTIRKCMYTYEKRLHRRLSVAISDQFLASPNLDTAGGGDAWYRSHEFADPFNLCMLLPLRYYSELIKVASFILISTITHDVRFDIRSPTVIIQACQVEGHLRNFNNSDSNSKNSHDNGSQNARSTQLNSHRTTTKMAVAAATQHQQQQQQQ